MADLSGAAALLSSACSAGVSVVFANPGTTEMHVVGALDATPDVRGVLCLHENVVAGAADGYARMERKPAMALLHLGVGLANGLANLHNARRAGSPVVVLVGEMATWHRGKDSLLEMDIVKLAETVSKHVAVSAEPGALAKDTLRAIEATQTPNVVNGSRIATLVVPHDRTWEAADGSDAPDRQAVNGGATAPAPAPEHLGEERVLTEGAKAFFRSCAQALREATNAGKRVLVYAGGSALVGDTFKAVGRIAAALGGPTKAPIIVENAFARIDRGAGFPLATRIPYFPQDAQAAYARFDEVLCVDARLPVALFGYKDGPSDLLPPIGEDHIWEIDTGFDIDGALELLEEELGARSIEPGVNCRGTFCAPAELRRPAMPAADANLTATSLCAIVAHLQPEAAVVVDESLTSGGAYWDESARCPPFSHLTLTGGAIGIGMPMAVGAAVACPDRVIINLQADGSGMYTCQALWTQARERLRVLTIVCFNNAYQILKIELMKQRINATGAASKSMTDLGNPPIAWEPLVRGMGISNVRGARTCGEMASCMEEALRDLTAAEPSGPWVIVANIA